MATLQRELLAQTPIAIDVGANVGQYAERLRDLGYNGRIISFEPGEKAFSRLARRASRSPNWDVHRLAIGATEGVIKLHVSKNSVSSSVLTPRDEHVAAEPQVATASFELVSMSTLDIELAHESQYPLWLKMDVQGFELEVLEGAKVALDRTLVVQTELSFDRLYDGQGNWLDVCSLLEGAGFVLRHFEPGFQDRSTGFLQQAEALYVRRELRA